MFEGPLDDQNMARVREAGSDTESSYHLFDELDDETITGITGAATADSSAVSEAVARIKRHTKLPVCVGFGIRTPETARAIASHANGAVVGTALVDALKNSLDAEGRATAKTVNAVAELTAALAQGVKGAQQAAE